MAQKPTPDARPIASFEDLEGDTRNANRGTDRGRDVVFNSIKKHGAGRSIVVDKHGRIIAGHKATEAAKAEGLKVRVVRTRGDEFVIVQREDLDLEKDVAARELAYIDNRSSELGLDWDTDILADDLDSGLDLFDAGFEEAELDDMLAEADEASPADPKDPTPRKGKPAECKLVVSLDDVSTIERAIAATGQRSRAQALAAICRAFVADLPEYDE